MIQKIRQAPSYGFLRRLWTTAFALCIIAISLLGMINNGVLVSLGLGISFTTYGLLTSLHTAAQILRASINYVKVKSLRARAIREQFSFPYCFLSFGHEEAPKYYLPHLESMSNLLGSAGGIFVVDGTSPANRAMVDMFTEKFPYPIGMSFVIPDLPDPGFNVPFTQMHEYHREYLRTTLRTLVQRNPQLKYLCLAQAHGGKREIMYLGMQLAHLIYPQIKAYALTDSDTIMTENAFLETSYLFLDEEVEAVTANVSIYNIGTRNGGNLLSRLAYVRYWSAFFWERAAQSMSKSVLCMSGPRWMVRIPSVFKEREGMTNIDRWKEATFLGELDNYGDDRGWTNVILASGGGTMFTPFGTCFTETPTDLKRFYKQQRRWNQSANREAIRTIWDLGLFKHPVWIVYEIVYQTFFPVLLGIGIVFQITLAIERWSLLPILSLFLTIFLGGLLKGIIAGVVSRDPWKLLQSLYGFVFLLILMPARIDAILRLWDTRWGTKSRASVQPVQKG
ncbi:MAG: hypothetical protein NVS4B12_21620 [Ktedonobacteraceae bacterium]